MQSFIPAAAFVQTPNFYVLCWKQKWEMVLMKFSRFCCADSEAKAREKVLLLLL
jgi:hypothetical protein